ncbi:hypothetical protein ACKJSM_26880 [Pseudomonas sp. PHC1]|uniref:hypothetical protein n=1 Tax=Pseudomonas sp. PHC1 TaxID=3384759 RepID=UPI00396F4572
MATPTTANTAKGVVKRITDNETPGLPPRLVIVTPDTGGPDIVFGAGSRTLLAINDRVSYSEPDDLQKILFAPVKKI